MYRLLSKLLENRFTRPIKSRLVRSMAARRMTRSLLNLWYGTLGERAKSRFHERYSKIFREASVAIETGEWTIGFCGRNVRLPMRPEFAWLDWDNAVSIVGHDHEVKQTYAAMLVSDQRPNLFIDIGANYGMHSTLFLSAGIPVLAFEPNPSCFACFRSVCELNGFSGRWEPVAIGNSSGKIELVYPERETWLGSVSSDIVPALKERKGVVVKETSIKKLDEFINDIPVGNVVLKIDVEGFELEVLRGASQVLAVRKPKIIFESNDNQTRGELYDAFGQSNYVLFSLPWRPNVVLRPLGVEEFVSSPARNFIAIANHQVGSLV